MLAIVTETEHFMVSITTRVSLPFNKGNWTFAHLEHQIRLESLCHNNEQPSAGAILNDKKHDA